MDAYEVDVYSSLKYQNFIVIANSIAHAIDITLRELKNNFPDFEVSEIRAKRIERKLLKCMISC